MKKFKFALLFYPVYIVALMFVFGIFGDEHVGAGALFGAFTYPLMWIFIAGMYTDFTKGESDANCCKSCQREKDNSR